MRISRLLSRFVIGAWALGLALGLAPQTQATVTNETTSVTYGCNGKQTLFQITFPYLQPSDIAAAVTTNTNPVVSTMLVLGVDYFVQPSSTSISSDTGNLLLTLGSSCPVNSSLNIVRFMVPYQQPFSVRSEPAYTPSNHELEFDRVELQIQELNSNVQSALAGPVTSFAPGVIKTVGALTGDGTVATPLASSGAGFGSYDIDFTAQPTQSFSSDGTYSIKGVNWNVVGTAYATMGITNGTGLVMHGTTTATTPAMVSTQFPLLVSGSMPCIQNLFDVWIRVTNVGLNTVTDAWAAQGINGVNTMVSQEINYQIFSGKRYNGGTGFSQTMEFMGSYSSLKEYPVIGGQSSSLLTDDVFVYKLDRFGQVVTLWSGVYGTTWPTTLTFRGIFQLTPVADYGRHFQVGSGCPAMVANYTGGSLPIPSTLGPAFALEGTLGTTTFQTITRMLVVSH